jgi:LysM repeat protein
MRRFGGITLGTLALVGCCLSVLLEAEAQTPTPETKASVPMPGQTSASPPGGAVGGDTYVVKKGDTLWGIAKSLFEDPFFWPRIAGHNLFIKNPNRIYPGDTLTLPGRVFTPAPTVEVPKPEAPKAEVKPPVAAAPPAPAPAQPAAAPTVIAPIPPVPPASKAAIACSPVLMNEDAIAVVSSGSIAKSTEGRLLLSQEDYVSVGFDGTQTAKVGDRLAVVRPGPRVIHPLSKLRMGRTLHTLGVLEVTDVREGTARSRVIYGCEAITVGDRVAPFTLAPFPEERIAKPATRQVEGAILDAARPIQFYGLQHLVYVDVGSAQGIAPGDVFAVYRPMLSALNPATAQPVPIAPERLGEAVVIRLTEKTATAVISMVAKEILPGDRVVLSRQIQP